MNILLVKLKYLTIKMTTVKLPIHNYFISPIHFLLDELPLQCYYTFDKEANWIMFHIHGDLDHIPCQYIKLAVYYNNYFVKSKLFYIDNKHIMLSLTYYDLKRLMGKILTCVIMKFEF